MGRYSIKALKLGSQLPPSPSMFFMQGWGEYTEVNVYAFLLRNDERTILIDTGIADLDAINPLIIPFQGERSVFRMEEEEKLPNRLAEEGLAPDDIDAVILTHFHYDHASNLQLFRKSRLFASKRGVASLVAPEFPELVVHPFFCLDAVAYLTHEARDRTHLCEDEEEIFPGVRVIWVGGHSPDLQVVVLDNDDQRWVFSTDLIWFYRNDAENIPPGFNFNVYECLRGFRTLRAQGGTLIPGHDPLVLQKYPGGLIA